MAESEAKQPVKITGVYISLAGAILIAAIVFHTILGPQWELAHNEKSAVKTLETIYRLQREWRKSRLSRGYATLDELSRETPGKIGLEVALAADPRIAKDGYYFKVVVFEKYGTWCGVARPARWGKTGWKNFQVDQEGVIRYNDKPGRDNYWWFWSKIE